MRDVEFRAFDTKGGGMSYPQEHEELIDYIEHYLATNDVIMQWTGLQDKTDRKIYEGDIVRESGKDNFLGVVIFMNGMYCIEDLETGESPSLGGHSYNPQNVEVLGNVYEDPELLEKKS